MRQNLTQPLNIMQSIHIKALSINTISITSRKLQVHLRTSRNYVKRQHQTIIFEKAIIIIQIGGLEAIALAS